MPGMYDTGNNFLQQAAPIAQGVAAFTQAYGQRQQQVHQMDLQDKEMEMKKQYYDLQMAKLKQKTEPTQVDMQNVMTNVYKFRAMQGLVDKGLMSPEEFNKSAVGLVEGAETAGEANAYSKILNMGGEKARYLSPTEARLTTSLSGQYAVGDRIASQEKQTGMKLKSQQEIEMAKRLDDLQKQNMDYLAKLKEFGYKEDTLAETKRTNMAKEKIAEQRNKILLNRPKGAQPKDPYIASVMQELAEVNKGLKVFDQPQTGLSMEGQRSLQIKRDRALQRQKALKEELMQLTGRSQAAPASAAAPAQPASAPSQQKFMGGAGPVRIYESSEAKSAPDGATIRVNGVLYTKDAKSNKLIRQK